MKNRILKIKRSLKRGLVKAGLYSSKVSVKYAEMYLGIDNPLNRSVSTSLIVGL